MFRVSRAGDVLFAIGSIGTIVLGILLAIDLDEYQVWDGWVIAALVLWALAMETGRRTGRHYNAARDRARTLVAEGRDAPSPELNATLRSSTGLVLHLATAALVVLLLVDMIYKPGA
jgi:drug/metabolite transporter (DMT)-like permease